MINSRKSYKREVALLVFLVCVAYPVVNEDYQVLNITMAPSIFLLAAAFNFDAYLKWKDKGSEK